VRGHPDDACPDGGTYNATSSFITEGSGLTTKEQEDDLGLRFEFGPRSEAYRGALKGRASGPTPTQTATPAPTAAPSSSEFATASPTVTTPTRDHTDAQTATRLESTSTVTDTTRGDEGQPTSPTTGDGGGFRVLATLASAGGILAHRLRTGVDE